MPACGELPHASDDPAPDLENIIEYLGNNGGVLIGTEEEGRARSAAITQIDQLNSILGTHRSPPGLGHNNPPPDEGEAVVGRVINGVSDEITRIQIELKLETPNALEVAKATSKLRSFWNWLGKKADMAIDSFVKAATAAAGVAVAAALSPDLMPVLEKTIRLVGDWLRTIVLPF